MIKLINEDAIEFMKTLKDESVDLIVTDPPYKVTARGNAGNSGGMMQKKLSMQGKIFAHNDIKPIEYIPEFYRLLKDGSHCYIMTNHVNLQEILNTATDCGFKFIKSLIWNKGNKIMGQYYMSQFEYILFFRITYNVINCFFKIRYNHPFTYNIPYIKNKVNSFKVSII